MTKVVQFTRKDGKQVRFLTSDTGKRKRRRMKRSRATSKQQKGGFIGSFFKARRKALPSRVRATMKLISGDLPW